MFNTHFKYTYMSGHEREFIHSKIFKQYFDTLLTQCRGVACFGGDPYQFFFGYQNCSCSFSNIQIKSNLCLI